MACQEFNHLEGTQPDILSRYGIVSCGFKLDTWSNHRNPDGSYSDRCVSEVYVNFSNGRELKILCMICSRINVIIHENSLIIMCCNNTGTRLTISDLLHYVNQVPLDTQALCSVVFDTYEINEGEEGIEGEAVDEVLEGGEDIVNPFKVISYIIRNNIQGRLTDCDESLFYSKNKEYCKSGYCKSLELDNPYSNPFGYDDDGLCKRLN
jgi:hypothetical protein